MKWLRRRGAPLTRTTEKDLTERAGILVREAEKAREARAAAALSVDSIHEEANRLRDSRAVAEDLRRLIEANGWTERIALSMSLRNKG